MKKTGSRAKAQRRKEERKELLNALRLPLRLCAFAGVILSLFTLCALAQQDDRGLDDLKRGDYPKALILLNERLNSNPNDTAAQRGLLRVYIETGRYTEAEATARKFLLKTPENGAVRHQLAETLAITGRHTDAIAEFERAAGDSQKAGAHADKLESDLRRAEVLDLIGQ